MIRNYIIIAENADDHIYELLNCEHCRYFRRAEGVISTKKDHTCMHTDAMVNPMPDSWCSFRLKRHHYE